MQVNAHLLREHSRRTGKPIAAISAFHDAPDEEIQKKLHKWSDEDFRGMPGVLELSEGARVLLTQNLWVEAGLMNGALGRVVGYMWPEGGDPASEASELKAPLYVVVEFDDVDLGTEPDPTRPGQRRPRSFFPDEPDKRRWVPIPRQKVFSASESSVSREQFPLTLAWALTHWKAQGMTLRRARVKLGERTAAMPGVGFVACTRVRHPTHLVFEDDLPEWRAFQEAQFSANFRSRKRFELGMQARFSETLRRYGFCEDDRWTREDADVADALLGQLRVVCNEQRVRLSAGGRELSKYAWLWPEGEPGRPTWLREQLADALRRWAKSDVVRMPAGEAVLERLLGPLHLSAVREALGCLFPPELNPRDDGKKPRGGLAAPSAKVGVFLKARQWRVDVSEEQQLAMGFLSTGTFEFFQIVLRRVSSQLQLPLALGTSGMGRRVGAADRSSHRLLSVVGMPEVWKPADVRAAQTFLLPVGLLGREESPVDWLLVRVSTSGAGVTLGQTKKLRVQVMDNRCPRRVETSRAKARLVAELIRNVGRSDAVVELVDAVDGMPPCPDVRDSLLWCLGMVFKEVADAAGMSALKAQTPDDFVETVRVAAMSLFADFRSDADESGQRDVLEGIVTDGDCRDVLCQWADAKCSMAALEGCKVATSPAAAVEGKVQNVMTGGKPLRCVTWNVAQFLEGNGMSVKAPPSWSRAENLSALCQEVLRWDADIVSLQECPTARPLPQFLARYAFVGASPAHAGLVHLYARPELGCVSLAMHDVPGVIAHMSHSGQSLHIVAVHLAYGGSEKSVDVRRDQLEKFLRQCDGDGVMILGDTNAREEEANALCKRHKLREAPYAGNSWEPARTQYHTLKEGFTRHPPGQRYDRVLYKGAVSVEVCVAGKSKVYCDGVGFYLSDHFAIIALCDVHEVHSRGIHEGRSRRGALCRHRDAEAAEEFGYAKIRDLAGRRDSVFAKGEADARQEEDVRQRARAVVRVRSKRFEKLREVVLGTANLFDLRAIGGGAADSEGPQRYGEVRVPCWLSIACEGWGGVARIPMSSSGPPVAPAWSCIVAQMLLRLPDVASWLDAHAALCVSRQRGACVACMLHALLRAVRCSSEDASARVAVREWASLCARLAGVDFETRCSLQSSAGSSQGRGVARRSCG